MIGKVGTVLLCVWLPALAHAGTAVFTAHPLAFSLRITNQGINKGGDGVAEHMGGRSQDLFSACVGTPPTKTEAVVLFIDCNDPNTNEIDAVDLATGTPALLAHIGSLTFPTTVAVETTTGGGTIPRTEETLAEIDINCTSTVTLTAQVFGVLNVKMLPLSTGGQVCAESGRIRTVGSGNITSLGDFIVDDGSSIALKPRLAGIIAPPPVPEFPGSFS